ncbi:hypothetical protein GCD22_01073 [Acidithiobacillus thiooxidans ATCC 19377]|uniref:Uncharacterized protein n=1 Tax=Acidithiobacillus thiooxidans ATCC 19377 TaxID=637390 RepID=A0A5P9XNX4_ACITH|nr:hypothetical protein GCD22_01073 [Acidithiobacillus thiooxidans ATCC 19377]
MFTNEHKEKYFKFIKTYFWYCLLAELSPMKPWLGKYLYAYISMANLCCAFHNYFNKSCSEQA